MIADTASPTSSTVSYTTPLKIEQPNNIFTNTLIPKGISASLTDSLVFRDKITERDIEKIRTLVCSTEMFTPAEIRIAVELAKLRILLGDESGYYFLISELNDALVGYSCFGPIACTNNRFDLYWIAVQKEYQHMGIGTSLLQKSEILIKLMGAKRLYVETSSQPRYERTRRFYQRNGYQKIVELPDFYADSDNKIIYLKEFK